MMAKLLLAGSFPQVNQLVRAQWAPVFLFPILGSPECFVIAIAVAGERGFYVESANELQRLKCLYGRAAETALFAADVALEELRAVLAEKGASALRKGALVFSGVMIGDVSTGEARTLQDLGRTWMSSLSSLYRYRPDPIEDIVAESEDEGAQSVADRLPTLVLEHVNRSAPNLARFFHENIRQNRKRRMAASIAGISIDFNGPNLVANFATLSTNTHAQAVDRIKRKMFDIKVRRDEEKNGLLSSRKHEVIIFTPPRENPLLTEKQVERLDEALVDLSEQSDREGFGFYALNYVPEIGARVLAAEAPAIG